jgi:hypothetical protein
MRYRSAAAGLMLGAGLALGAAIPASAASGVPFTSKVPPAPFNMAKNVQVTSNSAGCNPG